MISFYKWYTANSSKVSAFKLYKSKKGKDGPPYAMNWTVVDSFFSYLRRNAPFLGEGFMKSERKNFKQIDAAFAKYPKDELPAGFDYDRFTDTQESPQWFWQQLNKKSTTWTIIVSGDKANIEVKGKGEANATEPLDLFCGKAVKEGGVWKLATLACEATVLENNQ